MSPSKKRDRKVGPRPRRENELRMKDNESISDYQYYLKALALRSGYKSYTDYLNHWAKSLGYKSHAEYKRKLREKKGFKTQKAYQKILAEQKGVATPTQYQKILSLRRQKRSRNQKLALLIKQRLSEIGKNQSWLAREIGKSRTNVSLYARGLFYPKEETLKKIRKALRFFDVKMI